MKYVSEFIEGIFLSEKERSWMEEMAEYDAGMKGKCAILLLRGVLMGIWVGIAYFLTAATFAMVAGGYV